MLNSINLPQISQDFLKNLTKRQKEIISRRFGFQSGKRETLESIGKSFRVTRERIRQIERDGFSKMQPKTDKYKKIFSALLNYFQSQGGLKREDILFSQLASPKFQPYLYFLLTLHPQFSKFPESDEFYSLWTINQNSLQLARKINKFLISKLKEKKEILPFSKIVGLYNKSQDILRINLNSKALLSFVEISKEIEQGLENLFGLKEWPEITPRGVRDKSFLVLKREGRPLHFNEISSFIPKLPFRGVPEKRILSQTVHNELIKDPRFVLVGRGIYALRDWGYERGVVKDIIERTLRKNRRPMSREEVMKEVLRQRFVKESTVLLNLKNQEYFIKNPQGRYLLKEI